MESESAERTQTLSPFTGAVLPLGALYTKDCPVIGEFSALKLLAPFCKAAGLNIIQLLPVNDTGTQASPYSGLSAFALHPVYLSLKLLPIFKSVYQSDKKFTETYDNFLHEHSYSSRYDYQAVLDGKMELLHMLYEAETSLKKQPPKALAEWINENSWVIRYAVFKQLKRKYRQASWKSWPEQDRSVTEKEIQSRWKAPVTGKQCLFYAWIQFHAHNQLKNASDSLKNEGIWLKGDIPIMMNEDSCDAWEAPELFNHRQRAGSPPDAENPLGQNWGFPVYNWETLKQTDYQWWKLRLRSAAQYYSAYRLDHILGFFRIWAVPETETAAYLGHTEPHIPLTREELHRSGFDDGRIRWLAEPHIPTACIEDITTDKETAYRILSLFADRLGNEELWNFKKSLRGEKGLWTTNLENLCTKEVESSVRQKLVDYWQNRCLIEIEPDKFVPVWAYGNSSSWRSLNTEEQEQLKKLFAAEDEKQNQLWKQQSIDILSAFTGATTMIPCGEDLGAGLACVPEVLSRKGILGLRVVRWSREWSKSGQPFIPFDQYLPLTVTTTSVHDSPTLRQWWNNDKNAVIQFISTFPSSFGVKNGKKQISAIAAADFSPAAAKQILLAAAESASVWCIHPMQDFLYLKKSYWLPDAEQERINIPGTVTPFNWTYRMPVSVEQLNSDTELTKAIREISDKHKLSAKNRPSQGSNT